MMSSVQTGQLISLLMNNVLMVMIVAAATIAAWLRWHWLQANPTRSGRRRCRWAYLSFVLTAITLLGMLASLVILTLRAVVAMNSLVIGAMGIFLLSVVSLLVALSLWVVDVCVDVAVISPPRRVRSSRQTPPMALLPAALVSVQPRRRRVQRRQR